MINMQEIVKPLIQHLEEIPYRVGDISDLGNEIGYAISQFLDEDKLDDFIMGLKHGISLKNGTH